MSMTNFGPGVEITGRITPEFAQILSPDAVAFAATLQRAFGGAGTAGGGLADGLKELVDRFTGNGQQEVARSWVETGPNQQPTAFQLEQALGEDTISALTAQTGLSRADLLSRLQNVLPTAVDSLTPDGRLPEFGTRQERAATT